MVKFEYVDRDNRIPEAVTDYLERINDFSVFNLRKDLKKGLGALRECCALHMRLNGSAHEISLDTPQVPANYDRDQESTENSLFFCKRYFLGMAQVAGDEELRKRLKNHLCEKGLDDVVVNMEEKWDPQDMKWKFAATYRNGQWNLVKFQYGIKSEPEFEIERGSAGYIQGVKQNFFNES